MKPIMSRLIAAGACWAALCTWATVSAAPSPVITDNRVIPDERRMAVLEAKLASLRKQVSLLEDAKAIERLQQAYGYYLSAGLGNELAELFANDPTVSIEIGGRGVYVGKERIRAFLTREGEGLKPGELREAPMMQGVVHVAPDGKTAKGRWRVLMMAGMHGEDGRWIEGPYENEYVKEDGVWKFSKVHWYATVIGSYDEGWHRKPLPMPGPLEELPPDRPPSEQYQPYPAFYVPPFHYLHPVTRRPVAWE